MLNQYVDYGDGIIGICADGSTKYGLNILINKHRFLLIDGATNGYWHIKLEKDKYYAYTINNDKILYMHHLITGIENEQCEEGFISDNPSSKLISNPYQGRLDLVKHKDNNGLVNLDSNLIITEELMEYEKVDNLGFVELISDNYEDDDDYSKYLVPIYPTIDEEGLYYCDLQTILNIEDSIKRLEGLELFRKSIIELNNNRLFKRNYPEIKEYVKLLKLYEEGNLTGDKLIEYQDSVMSLYEQLDSMISEHQSTYYFEGHLLMIYPILKVKKASKPHLCCFSGARIGKGQEYIYYKLFIEDLTDSKIYTTKPISAEIGYEEYLPTTVLGLDDFLYRLSHSYEMDFEDYYNISTNIRSDNLGLTLLKRKNNI